MGNTLAALSNEQLLKAIDTVIRAAITEEMVSLEEKIDEKMGKLDTKIDTNAQTINQKVDLIDKKADYNHQEIMELVSVLCADTDYRFEEMNIRVTHLEADVQVIKATMVTKSYLDDKLFDFKAEILGQINRAIAKPRTTGL